MKQLNLALVFACALLPACILVDGSPGGDRISRTSDPGDFEQLVVSGPFDHVEVEICADCSTVVKIDGDDRQVDEVTLERDGDVLELGHRRQVVITDIDLDVVVRVPKLASVTTTGSADVHITGVAVGAFEIVTSGSGDLGIAGRAEAVDVVMSGSGDLFAFDLLADTVEITASGSGDADVCARQRLRVRSTGSGDVFYDCSPRDTDFDSTGSGRVSVR